MNVDSSSHLKFLIILKQNYSHSVVINVTNVTNKENSSENNNRNNRKQQQPKHHDRTRNTLPVAHLQGHFAGRTS
jgi:hypothetical protein